MSQIPVSAEEGPKTPELGRRPNDPPRLRIIAAMRRSVGRRGVAGSTYDLVTAEAGVSRGSIFYYFGNKERLLGDVVRADADARIRVLRARLSGARSSDEVLDGLVAVLESFLDEDRHAHAFIYEMTALATRNEHVRSAMSDLYGRWRSALAALLEEKDQKGALRLRADAHATAAVLTALGEGLALQAAADPRWDRARSLSQALAAARVMLGRSGVAR